MSRELPRTLHTLGVDYQRGIEASEYEVVVVDNGSPEPVDPTLIDSFAGSARLLRLDDARPSPAHAANLGVAEARGGLIGLIIDGARMASPSLLHTALLGSRLDSRAVIAAPAWHLGAVVQNRADVEGYDQEVEDALLDSIDWRADGYRLFEVATLANSSGRGWFGPMGESSALFMDRALWSELGGLDERFVLPGGGLMNHDLYRRACDAEDTQLIVLLGEGTIHQFHGGATTSGKLAPDAARDEYRALRGGPYRPPTDRPVFVGSLQQSLLPHLERSVVLATERQQRGRTMFGPSSV
jgi:hypothetical protein